MLCFMPHARCSRIVNVMLLMSACQFRIFLNFSNPQKRTLIKVELSEPSLVMLVSLLMILCLFNFSGFTNSQKIELDL